MMRHIQMQFYLRQFNFEPSALFRFLKLIDEACWMISEKNMRAYYTVANVERLGVILRMKY
jgi:hypothetical protein